MVSERSAAAGQALSRRARVLAAVGDRDRYHHDGLRLSAAELRAAHLARVLPHPPARGRARGHEYARGPARGDLDWRDAGGFSVAAGTRARASLPGVRADAERLILIRLKEPQRCRSCRLDLKSSHRACPNGALRPKKNATASASPQASKMCARSTRR